jgi:hypothetical protein
MYSALEYIFGAAVENSGVIVSTLSMSSILNYAVGILWNIQIASYYLFLNVSIPDRLEMFLNITVQMQ